MDSIKFVVFAMHRARVVVDHHILIEKVGVFIKSGVHIRLKSRLEIGDDASSIVNFGYHITDD